MTHSTPDPEPSWEQPKIVLGAATPPDGEESEPPMWTQPADAAELVAVAAALPVRRSSRLVEVIFGRLPDPRLIIRDLSLWAGVALLGLVLQVHWWALLASGFGILTSVVNLIRWRRSRP